MKAHLLFPRYFRPIGFLLTTLGLILSYLFLFQLHWILSLDHKLTPSIVAIGIYDTIIYKFTIALVLIGLLFIAFSKIKNEDELTASIRLNSLYWGILVNYSVFFILTFLMIIIEDGDYYKVVSLYPFTIFQVNLITPLVIFILRFYYLLNRNKDEYYAPPLHFLPHHPFNKIAKVLSILSIVIIVSSIIHFLNTSRDLYLQQHDFWYYLIMAFKLMPFVFLLWLFIKVSNEDEYINTVRLYAMQIAMYVNYGLLLLGVLSGMESLDDEIALIIIPLIFIIVFRYRLYQLSNNSDERSGNKLTLKTL